MTFQYITNEQLNGFDSYKYSCKGKFFRLENLLGKLWLPSVKYIIKNVVLKLNFLITIFRYITIVKLGDASFLECNSQVISSLGGAKFINTIRIFILSISNYSVMDN